MGRLSNTIEYGREYPSMARPIFIDVHSIVGRAGPPLNRLESCPCRSRDFRKLSRGLKLDGDWDLEPAELPRYVLELRAYYDAGRSSSARLRLRRYLDASATGAAYDGNLSEAKLQKIDQIYDDISVSGFDPFTPSTARIRLLPLGMRGFWHQGLSALRVAVGREGDLLWVGAQHRMAVALSLGLNNVPAQICAIHPKWSGPLRPGVSGLGEGQGGEDM